MSSSCIVTQLSQKKTSENSHQSSPPSSLPRLNISSSVRNQHDIWYIPSSNNLTQVPQPYHSEVETISNHTHLTSFVLMSHDRFYLEISKLFSNWIVFQDQRDNIVECIMRHVNNVFEFESNKGHSGVLELSVDVKLVKLVCRTVFYERILFRQEHGMVPASKSSMELLKKMEIDEKNNKDDECIVCLEELVKKESDYEILSMPCSHMFHGECITKWLETSHYCPICRFEMPMDEKLMIEQTNN
ncbi:hypothetical protein RND71_034363 [Anisodus tanguticus]|uniref:RING-type E3 ubiquitin transferase n=1 Tax=Anisodus tanguticus TaxID=243964 RepID=A0AAE1V455_9SOLA|nr:hypothetical protein RND71_034363 [Anisodus tanguticus]